MLTVMLYPSVRVRPPYTPWINPSHQLVGSGGTQTACDGVCATLIVNFALKAAVTAPERAALYHKPPVSESYSDLKNLSPESKKVRNLGGFRVLRFCIL